MSGRLLRYGPYSGSWSDRSGRHGGTRCRSERRGLKRISLASGRPGAIADLAASLDRTRYRDKPVSPWRLEAAELITVDLPHGLEPGAFKQEDRTFCRFTPAFACLAINAADRSCRSDERMAECSSGSVIAYPALGFSDRVKLT